MRILHCCLAAFYIDDFGYQENILPRMHKLQGHEVAILASTETYFGTELGYLRPSSYLTKDEIPVTRIPYVKWLPHRLSKKLRIYRGVAANIQSFQPDIIFLHDCQFISIYKVADFVRKHPAVKVFVDGHTDFMNSGKNWISRNILHKIIYKWCAQKIDPYTKMFYGVLPVRVDFYHEVYGIAKSKIQLLPLGADFTGTNLQEKEEIRNSVRSGLNLTENDFVLMTGGKLDKRKNIHLLMSAVNELNIKNLKLVVFGAPTKEIKDEIETLSNSSFIRYVGWLAWENTNNYLLAADVAIFPGTHSVLWEQAVGLGIPCIFRKWQGVQHIDLHGNCLFLDTDNVSELKEKIQLVYSEKALFERMKNVAEDKGLKTFSYYEIAKRAIE